MMNKRVNELLWIGLTGIFIIGINFTVDIYQVFWGDHNIWWTNQTMRLSFDKSNDNFEIYIGGKILQNHLNEKTIFSRDNNGNLYPIVFNDITVRLNNWDKIKSSILMNTTITGFGLGVVITLFVIGLINYFTNKDSAEK